MLLQQIVKKHDPFSNALNLSAYFSPSIFSGVQLGENMKIIMLLEQVIANVGGI